MSQHDMNVANQGFPNFRTDLNNALVALVSNSSGATEPTTKFAYQWWLDTSTTPTTLKIRNTANDTWITAMYLNQSTNLMTLAVGAGATGTPSYSTIGDLNTGIWFPTADTVALSTGGTERWRADSSGTFTVGGISTASRKFEVNLNGQTTISYSDNSLATNLTLDNLSTTATTNHGSGMLWRVCTDSSATAINSGRIAVIKEQLWTSTASTQDSAMVFYTTVDGSLGERMRISSAGAVGIGTSSLTGVNLSVTKNVTGATDARCIVAAGTVQSDVTLVARNILSTAATQAASFTLANLRYYDCSQGTFGATSAVTVQAGYHADSSLIGATTNYGFYGNIASGTGRWNFYAAGTAANYFGGTVTIQTASATALAVGLNGATNPAFTVDSSTASQAAGFKITGAATGGTVALVATDSGSNTSLTINAKGTGTIGIGSVSTGAVTITPATTISGVLTVSAGAVGAPAIVSATGTSDTGQWFPAADTVAWSTAGIERTRLNSSGNILVNRTTSLGSNSRLEIESASGSADQIALRQTSATAGEYVRILTLSDSTFQITNAGYTTGVSLTYGGSSWSSLSDEKLKTDLSPIQNALYKVNTLRAVTGRYKTDPEDKSRAFLIAQDVQSVLPEAVYSCMSGTNTDEKNLMLAYTDVIPLLVAAIKELREKIILLENKI